jgi:hypothetical protein
MLCTLLFYTVFMVIWQRLGKDRSPGLMEIAKAFHVSEGDPPVNLVSVPLIIYKQSCRRGWGGFVII